MTVMTMKYGLVLKGTFVLTPRGVIVATVRWGRGCRRLGETGMLLSATGRDDEGRIGSGPGRPLFGVGIAG